jgi:vitamin B12 transporter
MKTLSFIHQQWKCIFVFVFLLNVPIKIHAQDTVNPIVVSASRVAQTLSDVLPSVTVITRAEIERSMAPTVADLLQGEAGFEFGRNGGPGTVTSFFLRGQNSVSVAVYVDGVRSQVDSIGTVNAIDFPIAQIEKIEILRGNAGALYGEAAIGGVINITTRRGSGSPSQYASVSYGSRNTSEVVVGYSGGVDDLTFNISANQFKTD